MHLACWPFFLSHDAHVFLEFSVWTLRRFQEAANTRRYASFAALDPIDFAAAQHPTTNSNHPNTPPGNPPHTIAPPNKHNQHTHTHCTPLGSGAEMCSLLEEYPQLRRESDAKSPPPTRSAHPLWSSQLLASVAPERFHSHLQFHPAGRDMLPTHGIHTTTPRIRRREDVSHPLPAGRDVLST